jgi:hypothetical protein
MHLARKPTAAAVVAIALLLALSSIVIAGTTWGGRTYSTGLADHSAPNVMLLFAPATSMVAPRELAFSASPGGVPAISRSAPANKAVRLCPDPCYGQQLGVSGSVSGLGSSGDSVLMQVQTAVIITCTNQGGTAAPGRNLIVELSDSDAAGSTGMDANGRFFFTSSQLNVQGSSTGYAIGQPLTPASQYGCSNDNWTATVTNYQYLCSRLTAVTNDKPSASVLDTFSSQCTLSLP